MTEDSAMVALIICGICGTILLILCMGDPDILDGLIKMVNK